MDTEHWYCIPKEELSLAFHKTVSQEQDVMQWEAIFSVWI